jgi:hypothetical protein
MRQSSATCSPSLGRRFAVALATWRGLVTIAGLIVALSVLLVARTGEEQPSAGSYVAIGIVAALAVLVVASVGVRLAGVDTEAADIAARLAAQPDQQRLLTRWLERARWSRFVDGLCELLVWLLGTRTDGNILVWGTAGIAAGALAAELHHLRPAAGPRTARLEVRTVGTYMWPYDQRRMIAVAAAGVLVAIGGLSSGEVQAATWWGLGAAVALGVAHLAQRRVASRSRPALPDSLRRADDLARELAIGRGLAWPFTYFAIALVAAGCLVLGQRYSAVGFVGIGLHCYAIGLWWRNRRLGLDFLLREQREPLLA